MARRRKVMKASEMEQWLLNKGAIPVTEEIKKKPWYKEVSKLPPCMTEDSKKQSVGQVSHDSLPSCQAVAE